MNNREIADLFTQMADLMSIRGDNFHRTLAYRKGADTITGLDRSIAEMVTAGENLTKLPSIGKTLAAKIKELVTTGELAAYKKLTKEMPPALVDLLRVEGLGPKRVGQIYKQLGVVTLEELKQAAADGKLEDLPKMGKKSAEKILHNVTALLNRGDERTPIGIAYPLAHTILNELKTLDGVIKAEIGGSLRRSRETIGDIDLLVGIADGTDPMPIMDHFVNRFNVETIEGHGNTKSSVILDSGMKVDLRVLPIQYWGTLLSYFTGSQAHNVKLRELARKQGLSLNEYSFTSDDGGDDIICATEEEVYTTLNLPYIAPQLRENRGEIEAAQKGKLPELIQQSDIISDLHMHSTWSDGKFSILDMARESIRRGLQYIAITDHSYSLGIANGLTPERLWQQRIEVDAANAQLEDEGHTFHIFHGTEMEIRADGTLDFDDDVLAQLDFVIASLHTGLRQPRAKVMDRIMAAIDNRYVHMIGHPTGRLLGKRDGADLDMGAVIMAASSSRTILEINAHPTRLDLNAANARRAGAMGVKIAINCDAHHTDHFDLLHYGVANAQRAWLKPRSVINTWPIEKFKRFINYSG